MPAPIIAAGIKAAPYILQGLSALGGVFGKKKKHMDDEALRQMYGPRAVGKDTNEIANYILNSPYGQQLMASAAETGQGLQTDMNARAAASGLSPDTGASSGQSDFQVSAGNQAQTGLERQTKAGIFQSAMPIAADLVSGRMAAGLNAQSEQNATPNFMQRLGAAAGQVAASIPAPGAPAPASSPATAAASGMIAPAASLASQRIVAGPGGAPQLGAMPQVQMPQLGSPAPAQFSTGGKMRGALTNSTSAGMRRSLSGR